MKNSRRFSTRPLTASLAVALGAVALAACGTGARPSTAGNANGNGNGIVLEPQAKPTTTVAGANKPTTTARPTTTTIPANETRVGAKEATAVPFSFTSKGLDGATVDGAALYKGAPLMMVFVTPWCPVCLQEGPLFAAAAQAHPGITFAFVHASGSIDEYRQYLDGAGIGGSNVVNIDDTDGAIWRRFGVASQPSFVLVDSHGLMRASTGALDDAGLAKAMAMIESGIV